MTSFLHHLASIDSSSGPRPCKIKTKSSKSPPWATPPPPPPPLRPVASVREVLHRTSGTNNTPLFHVKCFDRWVPLTDTRLRKLLSKILQILHLDSLGYTFHSLCRLGATLMFNLNIPMQDIQSHGTWTLESAWTYITQDHNASASVAHSFHSLLHV